MKAGDLTTLANVKVWLNTGAPDTYPSTDDTLLARMITAASSFAKSWLSRDLIPTDYTLTLNGNGGAQMFMPQYPIISVSAVSVNGTAISARTTGQPSSPGFFYDKESVYNNGNGFPNGLQNIVISYSAGFQVSNEAATIPATPFQLAVSSLGRTWTADRGIMLANGTALVKVAAAPAAGQYAVVAVGGAWVYQFNTANANAAILISYGYCPEELEQALIELIGERYKTRERIGQTSKTIKDQTVGYSQKDFNDNIRDVFNQLKNVVPL